MADSTSHGPSGSQSIFEAVAGFARWNLPKFLLRLVLESAELQVAMGPLELDDCYLKERKVKDILKIKAPRRKHEVRNCLLDVIFDRDSEKLAHLAEFRSVPERKNQLRLGVVG